MASLQASLLQKIIKENITNFLKNLKAFSLQNKIEVIWWDLNVDEMFLWKIASRFKVLSTNILRIETRLYPNLFPEKRYLKVDGIELEATKGVTVEVRRNPLLDLSSGFDKIKMEVLKLMEEGRDPESGELVEVS